MASSVARSFILSFFLCRYLKESRNNIDDNPRTLTELKEVIGKEVSSIGLEVT